MIGVTVFRLRSEIVTRLLILVFSLVDFRIKGLPEPLIFVTMTSTLIIAG